LNHGVRVSNNPNGRRFAIGDIHGCFNTFESLLEDKLKLTKDDQLFLLGDYIDKGYRNREVLEYILELIEDGFNIFPLIGNHEYFIIRDVQFSQLSNQTTKIGDLVESKDLLDSNGQIEPKFLKFIQGLPYYYELDDFILVHAGLDFELENPLTDKMSMIYARNFEVDPSKTQYKILIHGHTPVNLDVIEKQIKNSKSKYVINLDNGCVLKHYETSSDKNVGRLCAFNLDTMELIFLENID
jgi:serine/threonine protein phosphatase 1